MKEYIKQCVYCGKEFKTNNNRKKLCDVNCQHEYEKVRNFKQREQKFIKQFESFHPNFKYHSGYANSEGMFKSECKICGYIQERSCQAGRPKRANTEIQCDNCNELYKAIKELTNVLNKRICYLSKQEQQEAQRIEKERALNSHVCVECGKTFRATSMGLKYCSLECKKKRNNRVGDINRRKKLKENGKIDWNISLIKLIKRDKNLCHICGDKCDKKDYTIDKDNNFIVGANYPSIDHVVPVSKGGTHTWDNIRLAHHYCNTIKSDDEVYVNNDGQMVLAI